MILKKPLIKSLFFPVFTTLLSVSFVFAVPAPLARYEHAMPVVSKTTPAIESGSLAGLYDSLSLGSLQLSREAFDYALRGYEKLVSQGAVRNEELLTIIDFSLPSSKKRLFVIDMSSGKLLYHTYVAHGRNSGLHTATNFSNNVNSFQSSLGFYVTENTYKGKHGYSLRLDGVEKGINDKALQRGIVMHAAAYVNAKLAAIRGYIGRSQGCPALPPGEYKSIIGKIKDGSCLFIYAPDKRYASKSALLKEASEV